MSTEPYRYRCPEGHSSISVYSEGYRCTACEDYYRGDPYDVQDTEFPVDDAPADPITAASVLRSIYRQTKDTDTTVKAGDIDDRTRAVGTKLHELYKHGLVERWGASSPYRWHLTDAGHRKARPLPNSNAEEMLAGTTDELGLSPIGAEYDNP